MELHEFHIVNRSLGAVYHGNPVTGGDQRAGGIAVCISRPARCDEGYLRKNRINQPCTRIKNINSIAGNILRFFIYFNSQVMLGNNVNGKIIFEYLYIRMTFYLVEKCIFNLPPGFILMVKDPVF